MLSSKYVLKYTPTWPQNTISQRQGTFFVTWICFFGAWKKSNIFPQSSGISTSLSISQFVGNMKNMKNGHPVIQLLNHEAPHSPSSTGCRLNCPFKKMSQKFHDFPTFRVNKSLKYPSKCLEKTTESSPKWWFNG